MNDKNVKNDKKPLGKTLTVEDLAKVIGGADGETEEGTLKVGGEQKGRQRESRYPPVIGGFGTIVDFEP